MRGFIGLGAVNGFLAVALGAFGAHALKATLEAHGTIATYQTGSHYHLAHALALALVGLLAERTRHVKVLAWAGGLFCVGIVLFAGSLYALAVSNIRVLGAITPLGGVCFLAGWALLAYACLRESR
jgi:uncharacterized membrane protein YgdD (TMEM256/DUF423 family)